jgi:hypothetical protein
MSLSLRATATKFILAAAVVVLATGGTVAGVAAASASGRVASATIDHQLCYPATGIGFRIPTNVVLKNQFSPNGFKPRISKVAYHCNPVEKILQTGQIFPITNPNAHLLCFTITETTQPTPRVTVTNQFGSATLIPRQPNLLCLPSWKSLTGPPGMTSPQPPGLSHFTCYPVKLAGSGYHPPPVMLKDEFASAPVSAQVSPVPSELCLPTKKIVGTKVYQILNAAMHLLCFPVTSTPVVSPVWDQNQFGTSMLTIGQTSTLCLPSTKRIG